MADNCSTNERLDHTAYLFEAASAALNRLIIGQPDAVAQTLIAVLSGGHALITGVPGLGKSRLVACTAVVLGLSTRRIQFTPDLMPSDIIGSEVLDETAGGRRFRFLPGPIFSELLMADEINRASPRTQSALLQAMAEGHAAVAGTNHPLPRPFHVLATQNPLEQEGTYPLPEAQLDRFLLDIRINYPSEADERAMLLATGFTGSLSPEPLMNAAHVLEAQAVIRDMPVGHTIVDAIMALVRGARPESAASADIRDLVAWGPGPRAAQALMLATRARALLSGRLTPSVEDVAALAPAALRHRMALNFSAIAAGQSLDALISGLVARL